MGAIFRFGCPHGFARTFGIASYTNSNLRSFACFNNGLRVGWVYEGQLGGGYLVGKVDDKGELTGPDIAYIYPDFRTAIRGEYLNGQLVSGRQCKVVSSRQVAGVVIPTYSEVWGPSHTWDPATATRISSSPLLQDPWEASMVAVRTSSMEQAGEGLFAIDALPCGSIVSLFNGIRLKTATVAAQNRAPSDYRIRLNADIDIDIPHECISLEVYSATLTHKANHSFTPNCEWSLIEHPRFGLIRALESLYDIAEGEEITVNYNLGMANGPEWYRLLWLRHVREKKKWTDEQVDKFIVRNHELTMKWIRLPKTDQLEVPPPSGAIDLANEEAQDQEVPAVKKTYKEYCEEEEDFEDDKRTSSPEPAH